MVGLLSDRGRFALDGSAVVVTGAGRGLGRGMALAAAAAGATVVAVARSRAQLEDTAAVARADGGAVVVLPWDLSDLESADALIAKAGALAGDDRLDGIVHAAGVQHRAPAVDVSVADWQRVLTLDLAAPFFLSTALHRARGAAAHVFVGSLTSHLGIADISPYAASRSGLLGVMRSLAVEWAPSGARVNGIAPGYFRTELTAGLSADAARAAWVDSRIPMGRLGVAEDLAGAVVFLLSDASSYVTGQMLSIDGGWTAA